MASVEAMVAVDDGTVVPKSMVMRWIPVTERLPKDNRPVLMSEVGCRWPQRGYYVREHRFWVADSTVVVDSITAWMELPEPYRPIEEDVW